MYPNSPVSAALNRVGTGTRSRFARRTRPLSARPTRSGAGRIYMNSLSVKTKLVGTLSIVLFALLLVSGLGLRALSKTSDSTQDLFEFRTKPVAYSGTIYGLQLQLIQSLDYALAERSTQSIDDMKRVVAENRAKIRENLEAWEKVVRSEAGKKNYANVRTARDHVIPITDEISSLISAGNFDKARE